MSSKKLLKIGLVSLMILLALAVAEAQRGRTTTTLVEGKSYEVSLSIKGIEPNIIFEDYEGYPFNYTIFRDYSIELYNLNMPKIAYVGDYSDVNMSSPFAFNTKITTETGSILYNTNFYATFFIYDSPIELNATIATLNLPYFSDAKYLKIYFNSTEKLNIELKNSLCNNDSICNNYENYYSCPNDCSIGAKDGICASKSGDSICDTDCMYDGDCDSDNDGIINSKDNCKDISNADQLNSDDFSLKKPLLYEQFNGDDTTKGKINGAIFADGKYDMALNLNEADYLAMPKVTAPTSGLILHLPFDEGSGATINDLSGNGNTGIINGAAWVDGKVGKALRFDGVNDYISVPSSDSLKPSSQITLSCWVKLNSYAQTAASAWPFSSCIHKTSGPTGAYVIGYGLLISNTGVPAFDIDDNNVAAYGLWDSSVLSLNEWHHLAGTYDGAVMALYVDGVLKGTTARTGQIDNSDYPLNIGNAPNEYAEPDWYSYINGAIDEVRIYNKALSSDEVKQLYATDIKGIIYNTQSNFNKDKGTIEFWIKPNWDGIDTQLGRQYRLFDEGANALHSPNHLSIGKYYGGGCNCNYLFFVIDDASWSESTAWTTPTQHELNTANDASFLNNWKAGEWHHIAAAWDNTAGMQLYVDGILTRSNTDKWARDSVGDYFYLGSSLGTGQFADAAFDEFKVYDSTLTADEIKAEYLGQLKDSLGDACDPCPKYPSDLCTQLTNDGDNDGILNENDLCPGTNPTASLITDDGCSCEQIKEALAAGGKGYAKGVLSEKNKGICRAAEAGARGILAKTGRAFGFEETPSSGAFGLIILVVVLAAIYFLIKSERKFEKNIKKTKKAKKK